MELRLTYHAAQRLNERTTLSEDQLFGLIHNRRCVIVGIEPFTNRLHKLIYSEPDKTHFVAIQDIATAEVITILPIDYHENLAWKISEKKLKEAVWRVSPTLHTALYPVDTIAPAPGIKCSIILVFNFPGARVIRKTFGSHRFSERPTRADDALSDPEFVEKLIQRFRQCHVPISAVEGILLANDKHDYFLTIPWVTLANFQDDIESGEQDGAGQRR